MPVRKTPFYQLPGRPIAYHPEIAPHVGGVKAAVLLCQLVYWTPRAKDAEGWIYKSQLELMFETGMSRDELRQARDTLKRKRFIEERYERLEHQLYVRVVVDTYNAMVSTLWGLPSDDTPRKRLKVNQIGKGYMGKWAFPTSGNRDSLSGDIGNADIAVSEIPEMTQREQAGRERDDAEDAKTCAQGEVCGIRHQPGLCGINPWDLTMAGSPS
jgi:hypothetical protein